MATFITTLKFTDKGVREVVDSPKRAAAFKAAAKKMGVKVSGLYWTLGSFDGIIVSEAPSEETITAAMLSLASQGNVQTTTSRAFDATEFEKIIAALRAE
jgi:uncharacterized protein with GYD domain